MKQFKSIQVGDYVINGHGRTWRVLGCYYGAQGHEDMIGVASVDRKPGSVEVTVTEMLVPLDMIPADWIFRPVDHAMWEAGPPISRDTSPAVLAA
jgi:hypothetical protein